MRHEFETHRLNEEGLKKASVIATSFHVCLGQLEEVVAMRPQPVDRNNDPSGRLMAIVRTKLEEACFFAKKAMAVQKENQA